MSLSNVSQEYIHSAHAQSGQNGLLRRNTVFAVARIVSVVSVDISGQ